MRALPNRNRFGDHSIILAETIDAFYPDSPYKNLIQFEIDIARISDSVVLFSEGYGSLAELGAFSQIDPVADRMMVIIQTEHYDKKSFIRDGPIRHLQDRNDKSVQVFDWKTQDNGGIKEIVRLSFDREIHDINKAIGEGLSEMPEWMALNPLDFGHKIIFTSTICEALGAATFTDVKLFLELLGFKTTDAEIHRMLFCGKAVGWLKQEQRGHTKYYLPAFEKSPCDFAYKAGILKRDTTRWKRDIRAYWRVNDRTRTNLIIDHPRRGR